MDDRSYHLRVPKRWVRIALIVAVTALVVAPLTAVATNAFNDVPNTNTHHDDITWLRDADVTRGCNPPANDRFCPNDFVTRAQMASFMERLATNQVVDAGTLEGKTAGEIVGFAAATATSFEIKSTAAFAAVPGSSVAFTQKSPGAAIVRFTAEVGPHGETTYVRARIAGAGFGFPGLDVAGLEGSTVLRSGTSGAGTYSMEWVFPDLPEGDHEVVIEWSPGSPPGSIFVRNRTTVVQSNLPNTSLSIQAASQNGVEPDHPGLLDEIAGLIGDDN